MENRKKLSQNIIIPFPIGGSTSYTATILAQNLELITGISYNVVSKSGNFGIDSLKHLINNNYNDNLLVGNIISNSMTPIFHNEKLQFEYLNSIRPITKLAAFPSIIITNLSYEGETLSEFLNKFKIEKQKLIYGTDFLGTYVDIDAIKLGQNVGLEVCYNPTNGANRILNDLIDCKIDIAFINVATATQNIGKFKPLAIYGKKRIKNFPNVQTMFEAGFEKIGTLNWQGLFVPKTMSEKNIEKIYGAVIQSMNTKKTKKLFQDVGANIVTSISPDFFENQIKKEMINWNKIKKIIINTKRSIKI